MKPERHARHAATRSVDLTLALRRADRRRRSAGAALFVVAITLALLAAMGVYGLTATAVDIRSAGHAREGMLAQHVAEQTMAMTAEVSAPGTAQNIINVMLGAGGAARRSRTCRTAKPYTGLPEHCMAESCLELELREFLELAKALNPAGTFAPPTLPDTFGVGYPNEPKMRVELTSPVFVPPPPGIDYGSDKKFAQLTVTVFAEMVPVLPGSPVETAQIGRGRMSIGPIAAPVCRP